MLSFSIERHGVDGKGSIGHQDTATLSNLAQESFSIPSWY